MEESVSDKKYWIIDFSFYVYNGSFAFTTKCDCEKDPECGSCKGKGKTLLASSKGVVTGGLYLVFQQMMEKIQEGWTIILAFDPPTEDLARTKMLDTYKGNRGDKPEYITYQMQEGMNICNLIPNIECYSSDDAESDDIMAAIAIKYAMEGHEVVVASRDKDMFPILDIDNISIYRDGGILTKHNFKEKFGFDACRFNEYLALCGDSADNFNLFKGLGPKAATWLIENTTHILEIYDPKIWAIIPPKYKKHLAIHDEEGNFISFRRDDLVLSLQLATLDYNANYYRTNTLHNKHVFKNKVEQLELKSVLRNIHLLFKD
jgi:5'-3' exonuclease